MNSGGFVIRHWVSCTQQLSSHEEMYLYCVGLSAA